MRTSLLFRLLLAALEEPARKSPASVVTGKTKPHLKKLGRRLGRKNITISHHSQVDGEIPCKVQREDEVELAATEEDDCEEIVVQDVDTAEVIVDHVSTQDVNMGHLGTTDTRDILENPSPQHIYGREQCQ